MLRIPKPEKLSTKILMLQPSKVANNVLYNILYMLYDYTIYSSLSIQWTNSINNSKHDSDTMRVSYKKPIVINMHNIELYKIFTCHCFSNTCHIEIIQKKYPENMKKIVGSVWKSPAK